MLLFIIIYIINKKTRMKGQRNYIYFI